MGRVWSSEPGHSLCINEGPMAVMYTGTWEMVNSLNGWSGI